MASVAEILTAIANSIRAKTGITDKMKIEEMPALIDKIQSVGGRLQSKTVLPTKEQIKVTPDSEYYGLSDVTVEDIPDNFQDVSDVTATPETVLATKSYVNTDGLQIGTMPDNGDVSAEIDGVNNTSVTIPEGYTSGGTVTYTGSGGGDNSGINPEWTDWSYFSYNNNRNDLVAKLKYSDTGNGVNFSYFVNACSSLTQIPPIDTRKGTGFSCSFLDCTGLIELPELDTRNGKMFSGMCSGCTSLKRIPKLNVSHLSGSVSYIREIFLNCNSLEYVVFENDNGEIENSFPVRGNVDVFSNCPLLDEENNQILTKFLNALINKGTATYTVTIGSTNLAKLTDDQVAELYETKNILLA